MGSLPATYRPRDPQGTVLWQVIQQHWESFRAEAIERRGGEGLPRFVERAFEKYLHCGAHALGFAKVLCRECGQAMLVPWSCKVRGLCPSCEGRRMAEQAAHLVDAVIPRVPIRQWVLSLPHWLRWQVAWDHVLLGEVLTCFVRAVESFYRRRAWHEHGVRGGQTGAITQIQRFADGIRINPHLHSLFAEGIWHEEHGRAEFLAVSAPTDAEVAEVLIRVRRKVLRRLARLGKLTVDDEDLAPLDDPDLGWFTRAALLDRVSVGERQGQLVVRLRQDPPQPKPAGRRTANLDGWSLHANTRLAPQAREQLEKLCRYLTRPGVCLERMESLEDGRILVRLKRIWSDGTWARVFEPLDLIGKLTALIPRPGSNLLRYHGVFAPTAALRAQVVPTPPRRPCRRHRGQEEGSHEEDPEATRRRYNWAELLRRCFAVEALICPLCGGRREVIALIPAGEIAEKILAHLKLPTRPPTFAPARAPPQIELPWAEEPGWIE